MTNFTTNRGAFFYSFPLSQKKQKELVFFMKLLEDSGIERLLERRCKGNGRPSYISCKLFATILYGFAFDKGSLRELEDRCTYDLRYIYLMDQETPDHSTFGNFINDTVVENRYEIFHKVTQTLLDKCGLSVNDSYIDGTKIEADANRYKFVWKPTTWHIKLSDKIRGLLNEYDLSRNVPKEGIIDSRLIAEKLVCFNDLVKDEKSQKDYSLLYDYLIKALEYEEKERICGESRNSYYKSDHSATAMCLKDDYYAGLGSSMHAAYNVQIMVSKGVVTSYYVSQSRADTNDFIPLIDRFFTYYGYYPVNICADAGYGSLKNWSYLHFHNINNYVKYQSWQGNVSGRRPDKYILNDDNTITCLNGKKGQIEELRSRHPKLPNSLFYKIKGCTGCGFLPYCRKYCNDKESDYRVFEVNTDFMKYKQESERNLLSIKGIELRVNRSAQAEGVFGVIKQDMEYTRLRRTGLDRVDTEIMLELLGYNIRKYFRYLQKGEKAFEYWKAPEDLEPEKFKTPSAKRLANGANKSKKKSANQEVKDSYRSKWKRNKRAVDQLLE